MVAAGFMVAGAGYFFGAGLAWIFRLEWDKIVAVSIETAFQNGGIAFILLKVSLEAPYGELASVAPVAQLVITGRWFYNQKSCQYVLFRFFKVLPMP